MSDLKDRHLHSRLKIGQITLKTGIKRIKIHLVFLFFFFLFFSVEFHRTQIFHSQSFKSEVEKIMHYLRIRSVLLISRIHFYREKKKRLRKALPLYVIRFGNKGNSELYC